MGAAALPPRERATILAGRLIREGLLQQSALSPVDAACDAARAAALADAILAVAERCRELADSSMPPAALEEMDFSPVLRVREEAVTPDAVEAQKRAMLARLDDLLQHIQQGGAG
jgi:V/A-type H+/Na+-transporting ATPase subunit A